MDVTQYRDVPRAAMVVAVFLTIGYLSFLYSGSDTTFLVPFLSTVIALAILQDRHSPRVGADVLSIRTVVTDVVVYCAVVPVASAFALLLVLPLALGFVAVAAGLPIPTVAPVATGIQRAWTSTVLTHWILLSAVIYGALAGASASALRLLAHASGRLGRARPRREHSMVRCRGVLHRRVEAWMGIRTR